MNVKEREKATYLLRKDLESSKRRFVWNDEIEVAHEKYYRMVRRDQQLLDFSQDKISMVSDCYIMYAIAHMGVSDATNISLFLEALCRKNPQLNIVYRKDANSMVERLKALVKSGFVFCFSYDADVLYDDGVRKDTIALYTLVDSGYDVLNQRLQKRLNINSCIQYKPLQEMIGWASATYVGSCIANTAREFAGYSDRVLRTKHIGTAFFPMELKTRVDEVTYYVAVTSSFLQRDARIQTEEDYHEFCAFKINFIKNYLCTRTKKGVPIVVVTVYDNADLMELSGMIYQSEILNSLLGQVYFTGEGIVRERHGDASKGMLQMVLDESEDIGYRFEYAVPEFI